MRTVTKIKVEKKNLTSEGQINILHTQKYSNFKLQQIELFSPPILNESLLPPA